MARRLPVSPADARAIAKEAYIYGFPLVDSYRIQYSYFVDQSNPEFKGNWNEIHNIARVYTPADKTIQTPNSDTPYSTVGADLRAEPLVLTFPVIDKDRYFSAQFIDAFTFNFAYVGSRTTGNAGTTVLLAGPKWKAETPYGIDSMIRCETELALILYRTQLFGPNDIADVKRIQAGYKVQTLSRFLGKPAPAVTPINFVKPISATEERLSPDFFRILNFVLKFCPTHPSEIQLMNQFARLGIGGDFETFDVQALSPEIRKAVHDGIADAWREYEDTEKQVTTGALSSGDLVGSRDHLKGNYVYRMLAAVDGIYGNSREEAMYPLYLVDSSGQKLDGATGRYALRLAPGQFPPVNAFWSLTAYELPSRTLIANSLNRYLINSAMLPDLKHDTDGGLTIYIQREPPGKDKESNWLPAPNGPFFLAMRLYWPKPEASNGSWKQPVLQRADAKSPRVTQQVERGVMVVPVTADNFTRAETDRYFSVAVNQGGFGKFFHHREPMPIHKQDVVRANRDTLYSVAVFDLDAGPVTIVLPDAGSRFRSMMVIDEDQYALAVAYDAGSYSLSSEAVGTRYVLVAIRTLVDPSSPEDIQRVHALQNATTVEQKSSGRFYVPNWDPSSQKKVRDALITLGQTLPDSRRMFGTRYQVDAVRHLIGTAMAWGGNPEQEAMYLNVTPQKNDGVTTYRLSVKDVPVDGFWSISVYNAAGYFQPNKENAYTLNNITANKEKDGSVIIQFGGCDGRTRNCLPIMQGWNYMVRLYRPRPEILSGQWAFPVVQPLRQEIELPPGKTA
jgi:hypothetical protein